MTSLPTPQARRLYVGGVRFYQVDGALYPSVTAVLAVVARLNLAAWARRTVLAAVRELLANGADVETALTLAEREPERVRDTAAQRGSSAHGAIAAALAGEPYPPEMEPWVEAALAFLEDYGLSLLASEHVLVSRRHGFAGTCDVASLQEDGGLVLLDWKTGGIWPEAALQLGAYSLALEEMTGREVREAYVVGLRQGSYEARRVDLPVAQQGFLGALALWRALHGESIWLEGQKGGGAMEPERSSATKPEFRHARPHFITLCHAGDRMPKETLSRCPCGWQGARGEAPRVVLSPWKGAWQRLVLRCPRCSRKLGEKPYLPIRR